LEQALGKNWFDNFVPTPTRDSVRNVVRSLMTGEAASFEYYENPILTRGGEERWIAWHNTLLRDYQGAIVGTLSAGNDITETKRLEEELRKEEERWRTYVEDAADLIFTTDDTGKLASVNRAVCETTGFSAEELIGRNPLKLIPPEGQAAAGAALGKMLRGEAVHRLEVEVLSKDGRLIALEVRGRALYDGNRIVGTFQIARDVTERKHMEEELRRYSKHLEEMVRERTEKLHDVERLATIGEMAAMVGHDLRNPLTGIAAAIHLLKMRLDLTGDYAAKEAIRIIERSIEHSNKIIGDLMEYSAEMRLQPTVTDPRFLTRAALSLVTIPESVRILDETRSEPRMTVHVERVVRVFANLIRNAVEAMPQGGTLRMESRTTDGWVEIDFADTGLGMTAETMGKLWTPLFTTKARGMGFGLAVSKRIIEAHGGSVSVESIFGKGSTFTVKLPIRPELREVKKA
jgi:PAS domain S-box-containing protein